MGTVRGTRSAFLLGLSHPGRFETVGPRGKLVLSFNPPSLALPSSHQGIGCYVTCSGDFGKRHWSKNYPVNANLHLFLKHTHKLTPWDNEVTASPAWGEGRRESGDVRATDTDVISD